MPASQRIHQLVRRARSRLRTGRSMRWSELYGLTEEEIMVVNAETCGHDPGGVRTKAKQGLMQNLLSGKVSVAPLLTK